MNTIDAYEKDILIQAQILPSFNPKPKLSESQQRSSVFCGSGDSLCASMLAEIFSDSRARAFDPLDLIKNKNLIKNKHAFIVSISGKTISNVRVARMTEHSTAITANPQSKLAKICSDSIYLNFPNSDLFTAGSISFLEAALTCISLVSDIKIKNPEKIFSESSRQASRVSLSDNVYFLGNYHTYPIALYGAAKLFEVLGARAFYERLEQFSHMELFSVKKNDTIIIFEEKNRHNEKLVKTLKKIGLNVIQPTLPQKDKISQILFYTFFSQMVPLFLAKKRHQNQVHFMTKASLKNASDSMIY